MSVPLEIKKTNSAGTTRFEPKFIFLFRFSTDYYIETRTIPLKHYNLLRLWVQYLKKIIADRDSCASPTYTSPLVVNYMGFSQLLKSIDQQRRELAVRAYFRCYAVRWGVSVLAKGFKLTLNGLNLKKIRLQVVNDFG